MLTKGKKEVSLKITHVINSYASITLVTLEQDIITRLINMPIL